MNNRHFEPGEYVAHKPVGPRGSIPPAAPPDDRPLTDFEALDKAVCELRAALSATAAAILFMKGADRLAAWLDRHFPGGIPSIADMWPFGRGGKS